ncbi:hypothetical protein [Luteimicrobium sp. DT211]|uniref:hypothetical protein n=1 Tax=Luteimicrobium sp. DT211 TaxID=3393412 RepID=UPI003CF2F29B
MDLLSTATDRDVAFTAAVLGVAGFAWFGWAQEAPPASWRLPLGIAAGLCFAAAVVGGILGVRWWDHATALATQADGIRFGVIVAVEVALCAAGAMVLARTGHEAWLSAWICGVVGIHFVPLARVFRDPGLVALAVLLVVVAVGAWAWGRGSSLTPSALVGALAGSVFALFVARALVTLAVGDEPRSTAP